MESLKGQFESVLAKFRRMEEGLKDLQNERGITSQLPQKLQELFGAVLPQLSNYRTLWEQTAFFCRQAHDANTYHIYAFKKGEDQFNIGECRRNDPYRAYTLRPSTTKPAVEALSVLPTLLLQENDRLTKAIEEARARESTIKASLPETEAKFRKLCEDLRNACNRILEPE